MLTLFATAWLMLKWFRFLRGVFADGRIVAEFRSDSSQAVAAIRTQMPNERNAYEVSRNDPAASQYLDNVRLGHGALATSHD